MIVRELLSGRVDTCAAGTKLAEAARLMVEADIGSLAVVEKSGMVGILTERDVLRAVAEGRRGTTRVEELMTAAPDSLDPDFDVDEAAEWLMAAGYRHLPVIDDRGQLLGMLSIKDVMWAISEGRRARGAKT